MLFVYKLNYSKWFLKRDREKCFVIKRYMVLFDLRKNVYVLCVYSEILSFKFISCCLILFFFLLFIWNSDIKFLFFMKNNEFKLFVYIFCKLFLFVFCCCNLVFVLCL